MKQNFIYYKCINLSHKAQDCRFENAPIIKIEKLAMERERKKKEDCDIPLIAEDREEERKKLEEVVSLRVEVDKMNKKLNNSLVLDNILSYQRLSGDKIGLGYIGASSSEEDTSSKPPKEETQRESRNAATSVDQQWIEPPP